MTDAFAHFEAVIANFKATRSPKTTQVNAVAAAARKTWAVVYLASIDRADSTRGYIRRFTAMLRPVVATLNNSPSSIQIAGARISWYLHLSNLLTREGLEAVDREIDATMRDSLKERATTQTKRR